MSNRFSTLRERPAPPPSAVAMAERPSNDAGAVTIPLTRHTQAQAPVQKDKANDRVVDASLGYFINPLVTVLLGVHPST